MTWALFASPRRRRVVGVAHKNFRVYPGSRVVAEARRAYSWV